MSSDHELTKILGQAEIKHTAKINACFSDLYDQLKRVAKSYTRSGETVTATALIHEAYFKIKAANQLQIQDRNHFLALCCNAMRQLSIDHLRSKRSEKRGGGKLTALDESNQESNLAPNHGLNHQEVVQSLFLDKLVDELNQKHPRQAKALMYFEILEFDLEEVSSNLEQSVATTKRDLQFARAWLKTRLSESEGSRVAT
jgi:RNA polymerase sigma factor (TIGR02999 family)